VCCASAGAERRGGVLCADPAYVVIPQAKKQNKNKNAGPAYVLIPQGGGKTTKKNAAISSLSLCYLILDGL
jgi:hypothetical protein